MKTFLRCLLVLFVVIFATLVFVVQYPLSFQNIQKPNEQYNDVFRRVTGANSGFGDVAITSIAMIGSHDTFSYGINYSSKSNTNEKDNIVNNWFAYNLAKGFEVRYSVAQAHNIIEQLNAGVRYLDVRITYLDGKFYTSHGLLSITLKRALLDTLKFLNENDGEFIIFDINQFYYGKSNWAELNTFIDSIKYENKSLFDYVNYDISNINSFENLTYNLLTNGGTKAGILMLGDSDDENFADFYKLKNVDSRWHNITSSVDIIPKIEENSLRVKDVPNYYLKVNQSQTTPKMTESMTTLFGWSLIDMATHHNNRVLNSEHFDEWLSAMPIYLCDYSTTNYNDFNNKVNQKIIAYNIAL